MASNFKDKLEMTMFIIIFPYYFYQAHLKPIFEKTVDIDEKD